MVEYTQLYEWAAITMDEDQDSLEAYKNEFALYNMLEDFERNWSNTEAYFLNLESDTFPISSLLLSQLRVNRQICWRIFLAWGSNENLSFAVCLKQIILGLTDFSYCIMASIPSYVMSTLQQVNREHNLLPMAYEYLCWGPKKIASVLKTSWS